MAGATLGVAAVLVTSCDRPSPTQSPALTGAPRRVTALVGHAVRTLAVTVRAGDLPTPLVFNLPGPDGVATGTITIPFGPARTIDVTALDVTGGVTQEGSVTLTVAPGPQPTVAIALTPRPDDGSPPITVILADYGVVVTPSTAMIDGAVARTRQFTATVTDVNGDTVAAPQLEWSTMKAAVATVTADGLVTGVANGLATIVVTYRAIVGQTAVTVTGSGGGAFRLALLTAGYRHTCGLTVTGAEYCWGSNSDMELGDGTAIDRSTPTAVAMPAGVSFTNAVAGWSHSCGLTAAGRAYCWGDNAVGQLGDGTVIAALTPVAAAMPAGVSFASLSADGASTCGSTTAGPAYCWGDNAQGQIGDGTTINRRGATAVSTPAGVTFATVETGGSHACGLTATGAAYCWGDNSEGQLGDGSTISSLTPIAVAMPGGVSFRSLAVSFFHTCGLSTAGAAYCWGYNGVGELGDGTTIDRWIPTVVIGTVPFTVLSTVYLHTCGLTPAGQPYCWGDNRYGQIGDGTTVDRWTPTAVTLPAGVSFTSLVAGSFHTCAISAGGTPYCWGANIYGQLGDGTTADRWTPTAVGQP